MRSKGPNRRQFLKRTVAASSAAVVGSQLVSCAFLDDIVSQLDGNRSPFDPKGIPTRPFGKSGVEVPVVAVGTGTRFLNMDDEDAVDEMLSFALDNGLYYWDTAAAYFNERISAEERLGRIVASRRSEIFLSTKVQERTADEASRTIERSLVRLKTDYLDVCHVHGLDTVDEALKLGQAGGVLEALRRFKDEGVIRSIGFSGHTAAETMKTAAGHPEFDAMLVALNHYQAGRQPFEEEAVPLAAAKGMAVMVMKVVRPKETVPGIEVADLIRYALSLEHVTAAVIGLDSLEVARSTVEIARSFVPMATEEMEEVRLSLAPFYEERRLPWLDPSYRDGGLA